MELVLASRNVHKIRELRNILKNSIKADILSLMQFQGYLPPEEIGTSFMENAITKAVHAAKALNLYVLGEDSGLIVPALNDEPGIYSRRYAGPNATDAENRAKLLKSMSHFNDDNRCATFVCCLAFSSPEGLIKCMTGKCEGRIAFEEKGAQGFGYDSLFIPNGYSLTFGKMEEHTKNRISHRQKAVEKMIPTLSMYFK